MDVIGKCVKGEMKSFKLRIGTAYYLLTYYKVNELCGFVWTVFQHTQVYLINILLFIHKIHVHSEMKRLLIYVSLYYVLLTEYNANNMFLQ